MADAYHFDPTILREYDIRGIVGKTLNPADARAVGHAYGTRLVRQGGKTVATGYDGRTSSPELESALVDGLVAAGLTVRRVGLGPTPMLYYATHVLETDGGVMITGSHNPPEYNGIKMTTRFDGALYGDMIQEIGRLAAGGDLIEEEGHSQQVDILERYVDRIARDYRLEGSGRPLTVAWDAGNGAGGEVVKRLVDRLPGEHHTLFTDIDGSFPNHHPDPTIPENLTSLIELVKNKGCDLGIGFDGDADRIGVVDDKGRIVWGDQLMALLARDVLAENPGKPIIADVKSSLVLFNEIERLGGQPVMWKTGHSLIKQKLRELGAPLAGEMSGHIIFADKYYGFDDAIYDAVRLLDQLARFGQPLSALYDQLPQTFTTPETRFQVDEDKKFKVIEEVQQRLAGAGDTEVNAIDGVRVSTSDGWWLLRASNTQDVLVARAESTTEEGLERLKGILVDQLNQSGIPAPAFKGGGH